MEKPESQEFNTIHENALELNHDTFYDRAAAETDPDAKRDLEHTIQIAEAVQEVGGRALVVGGHARDEAWRRMGHEVDGKDIDIEVYGVELEDLMKILKTTGKLNEVGKSFAVMKVGGLDVSIPRRDSKVQEGHGGFDVTGDPTMTFREAASRRDFTMNALALDPLTGQLLDEYGGLDDMRMGVLRATDYNAFGEDPLRVLRAMQFAGRFNMQVEARTAEICRELDVVKEPARRIGDEWDKLLLKSPKPSVGMEVGLELGIIEKLHPEILALVGCKQEPEWHPEGDVWIHTRMVVDEAAAIVRREGLTGNVARTVMLAALCHDLGKPGTTKFNHAKNRITSFNHEAEGVEPTVAMLSRWEIDGVSMTDMIRGVGAIVKDHLYPAVNSGASDAAIRRLAKRLYPARIKDLVFVAEADHRGRALPFDGFPNGKKLLDRAEELRVDEKPTERLIFGRDLIDIGLEPGKHFGTILAQLLEVQEEGRFDTVEGGIEYYRTHIAGK